MYSCRIFRKQAMTLSWIASMEDSTKAPARTPSMEISRAFMKLQYSSYLGNLPNYSRETKCLLPILHKFKSPSFNQLLIWLESWFPFNVFASPFVETLGGVYSVVKKAQWLYPSHNTTLPSAWAAFTRVANLLNYLAMATLNPSKNLTSFSTFFTWLIWSFFMCLPLEEIILAKEALMTLQDSNDRMWESLAIPFP